MNVLLIAGASIIVVLATIAGFYHWRLYQKRSRQAQDCKRILKDAEERRQRNIRSIVILSRAVIDDQVSLTEASIRINALVQTLSLDTDTAEVFVVFRQLSEATAHIPILDEWRSLDRKRKIDFEKERERIESTYRDFVRNAASKIVKENLLKHC